MTKKGKPPGGSEETTAASMDADQAMARYARGDAKAFEIVYDAVAPRLEGYLRKHVPRGDAH